MVKKFPTNEIKFGDNIKLLFPDGDCFYMSGVDIIEILSEYFEGHFHPLLSEDNLCSLGLSSMGASDTYKKRKEIAREYRRKN